MPQAPNTVLMRVTLFQELDAIECQNVMYVRNRQTLSDVDYMNFPADFINNFNLVLKSGWQACQGQQVHWNKIRATVIVPFFGPEAEAVYGLGEGGSLEGNTLPSFCAAVITKRTGLSGRKNRGRFYIVGLVEADVFEETIQDAEFTRLTSLAGGFTNIYGSLGASPFYEIVLYSHLDGDVAGHPTLAGVKPLVQHLVRRTVYTQRHRLVGHGT